MARPKGKYPDHAVQWVSMSNMTNTPIDSVGIIRWLSNLLQALRPAGLSIYRNYIWPRKVRQPKCASNNESCSESQLNFYRDILRTITKHKINRKRLTNFQNKTGFFSIKGLI